ncbi:formyltetrahydrofolate deformylase [Vibrio astriarenae]|nr:formyltetrahydrofolate deformylase [Vibrio sp. C7]
MRTELEGYFNDQTFLADLDQALPDGANRKLVDSSRKKVVILVTKEAHCLGDILMKTYDAVLMSTSLRSSVTTIPYNHSPRSSTFPITVCHMKD